MLKITNLKKTFGEKTAVDIAELGIQEGEIVGLVGNNGAGKTTLFRLCLDLLKADQGNVLINECDPALKEDWKQTAGSYIDESFLIDFLTPEEYFQFVAKACNIGKDVLNERIAHYETFMSGEIMNQKKLIRDFSAGNKQKIGIIAAMLNQPSLLILDEPFNFLDPSSQNILKTLLQQYNEETNATIVISSHNLQHTIDISTRILLLENGIIVKDLKNGSEAEAELENYFAIPNSETQAS